MKDIKALVDKIVAKKQAEEVIKQKYRDKAKLKALTTAERLSRIEEILGL